MVNEGRLVAYDGSEKVKEFGQNFVAAAVASPEKVITVNKGGLVEEWRFDPKFPSLDKVRMWGTSDGAVSIQASGDNCTVTKANGQTDMYINRQKSRTVGNANTPKTSSEPPPLPEESSYQPEQPYQYEEAPDGFMAGLGYRCKRVIKEPINGPWATICVVLGTLAAAYYSYVLSNNPNLTYPTGYYVLPGVVVAGLGLSYWLRNVLAKILVRSWYGLPLTLIGLHIIPADQHVGIAVTTLGVALWVWPAWPLIVIALAIFFVVMAAIGKSTPTMDRR